MSYGTAPWPTLENPRTPFSPPCGGAQMARLEGEEEVVLQEPKLSSLQASQPPTPLRSDPKPRHLPKSLPARAKGN